MTVRVHPVVIDQVDKAHCPQCGCKVFVPSVRLPPDDPDDPVVWCRDMGHWEGRLSECDNAAITGGSPVHGMVGETNHGGQNAEV